MDTRLIFRDYRCSIKSDAGTQTVSPGEGWSRTRMKGERERKVRPFDCQEKPLGEQGIRTTNRHRWSR